MITLLIMQTKQFEQSEHFTHLSTFQYFYQLFQLIVVVPNEKVTGGVGGVGGGGRLQTIPAQNNSGALMEKKKDLNSEMKSKSSILVHSAIPLGHTFKEMQHTHNIHIYIYTNF